MFQNVEVEEEHVDDRSVDDLLSFINGNDGGKLNILILLIFLFTSCILSITWLNGYLSHY